MTALEIQTQQLHTILNKRANDTRAATAANDDIMAQVGGSTTVGLVSQSTGGKRQTPVHASKHPTVTLAS